MQMNFPTNDDQWKEHENYWLEKLSGDLIRSNFRYDFKKNVSNVRIIESVEFHFPEEIYSGLTKHSENSVPGLFNLLTSGLVVLLGKHTYSQTGIKDIILGIPTYKSDEGKKPANAILALRNQFEDKIAFNELLLQVTQAIGEAQKHKDYPVEELPERLNMQVYGDDFPLFDVAAVIENIHDTKFLRSINVNMIFSFYVTSKNIEGVVGYNASLYEKKTIKKIITHYNNLLKSVLPEMNIPLYAIDILSTEERTQLLFDFNKTKADYPANKTIHELFDNQVEKNPDNIAVKYRHQHLSYKALQEKSNRLAHRLRKKGLRQDQLVGVMVSRSLEMIAALLAVLKGGGAYVPIDPGYPIDRITFYLEDSDANILLTQEEIKTKFDNRGSRIEAIDLFDKSAYGDDSSTPTNITSPHNLAYVIFTSGSTGKPKGVTIRHRNAVNFFKGMTDKIDFSPGKTILAITTVSFDIFLLETLLPVTIGLKIVIADERQQKDPGLLKDIIGKNQVALLQATPSRLKLLLTSGSDYSYLKSIESVLIGGEAVPAPLIENLKSYYKGKIYDVYGPTETTVWSTMQDLTQKDEIDIGTPIANTQVYIIDQYKQLQPIGVIGELYIGGDGVARGYLNRPELTAERFINSPFSEADTPERPYKEIYQTGDLARWMPDGSIDFLGRIDHQVKIRGFRIETGEIEAQISAQEGINEAVVIARKDASGDNFLCAYFTADQKVNITTLENTLSTKLLDYMIPSFFVQLDKIPLTPNGKVDRKKLPDPKITGRRDDYIAPRDEIEEKLVTIWAQELHMDKSILGIDDNFFKLGGHSLKAAVIITKIHKELEVKVLMHELFEMPTIRKLGELVKAAAKEEYISIPKAPIKEFYPQVSAQKRMYFMQQLAPSSTVYNIQLMDIYCKGIELERLQNAIRDLILRHESLRMSFLTIEGEPVLKVHDFEEVGANFEIEYYETSEDGMIYSEEPGKEWTRVTGLPFQDVVEHFVRPFDLTIPPLLRVGLIKITGALQILMIDMHHIISDGVSEVLIIKELWELYERKTLPSLPIQYRDYTEWATRVEHLETIKRMEPYWLNVFAGEVSPLNLPYDYPRPTKLNFDGDTLQFEIDPEETQKLINIAQEKGATLYMILFALYNVLLGKLSGQEDIIVGTVAAGRNHADLQNLIGMFVETLVLRNSPEGKKTFEEFLEEVKQKTLSGFENQDYPFETLVSKVAPNHDRNRNPLFDVAFALENETERSDAYLLEVLLLDKSNPYTFNVKQSKFDMLLTGADTPEGLQFKLEYNTSLFKLETVERFTKYFAKIVTSVCKDIRKKIAEIEIITLEEKNQILYEFNDTKSDYPTDKTIIEMFEERIEKTPGNIALKYLDDTLTYREFNEKSNSLARTLREKGVKPENLVGIMMERSIEMIVGIYAILKAGGAYLPIDPNYPRDRIRYLFKDSSGKLLLTQERFIDFARNVEFDGEIMNIEDASCYQGRNENLPKVNSPEDMAYVIYTSGSTGKPKGVMIEHVSAVNLLLTLDKAYPLKASDSYLYKTAFLFDVSVSEIFGWFWQGGRLVILKQGEEKDPLMMIERIEEDKITHLNFVPSMFNVFVSMLDDSSKNKLAGLKYIFLAGEAIWPDSIIKFRALGLDVIIDNIYGPTEATVYASWYPVAKWKGSGSVSIGRATDNLKLYILSNDEQSKPRLLPVGIAGELTVSGIQLARGYLNRPELTTEKFVDNPYAAMESNPKYFKKLYHTGDLTRWHTDGNIEYMGRIDFQVKVRGFRIELGEIETQLSKIDGVKEGVVIVRENKEGEKYLCAYLVSENELDTQSLRETLSKNMPAYMVPSHFVQIDQLPLNPSGKLDRKALPEPETQMAADYIPPTNEMEEILGDVWSEILGIEKISIDENFFEIGGDSIKTIMISARLLKQNLSVNINDFYSNTSIRKLAKQVKRIERVIDQGPVVGSVELTPIQQWLFRDHLVGIHHFNQCILLVRQNGFDEKTTENVFKKIVEHHDAFRMVFKYNDDSMTVHQENRNIEEPLYGLEKREVESGDIMALEELARKVNKERKINLESGPLVMLTLIKTRDKGEYSYLFINIHHLVIDGISWRILLEDFENGYKQALAEEEIKFQEKTDSFKDWACKLKEYADSPTALKELNYWKEIETAEIKSLPVDCQIDKELRQQRHQKFVKMELASETTKDLLTEINWVHSTEINDVLLTAVAQTVREWAGLDKVMINLEGHGREKIIDDVNVERTIGWFTTQYPIILDMEKTENTLSYTLRNVKETLRRIPNKGIGYGIIKYLTQPAKKEFIRFKRIPEIVFNYLGEFAEANYSIIDAIEGMTDLNFGTSAVSQDFFVEHKIDFEGAVDHGTLLFLIYYNEHEYKRESIEKLAAILGTSLENIIGHCKKMKKEILSLGYENAWEYHIEKEYEEYRKHCEEEWPDLMIKNDYKNILLTGGTGFLGSHMLAELLANTDATLFLPVRGSSQNIAEERFTKKMTFYFGEDFLNTYKNRLSVIRSDLSEDQLGMEISKYNSLMDGVDAIVHTAANVKHMGTYRELHKDNVISTEKLLELAVTGKKKDFHYISTISVGDGYIPGREHILFTEFCSDIGMILDHIYLRSKFEAEKRVLAYREKGMNGSIYRVGNLIFHSETGKFQENIGDDYFYNIIRGAVKLKMLSHHMREKMIFDMSFINYTAKAVVLLLMSKAMKNQIHHVLNPNTLPMTEMAVFLRELGFELNEVEKEAEKEYLSKFEGDSEYEKIIEMLKVHSWVFADKEGTQAVYKMDRTEKLLKKLGLEWPKTTKELIEKMITYCREVGFL
jgi:amino acid adenylation domain-containing protein/thioester reductase-like protein/non-ribosomal peptide synthase protein (TIGR01720 family)